MTSRDPVRSTRADSRVASQSHRVSSFDGTLLHVEKSAGGDGTPVLLCNGIGAAEAMWTRLAPLITRRHPLVTWDYRWLHRSEEPTTERFDASAHAEDAVAVLDDLGIDKCHVLAWSSGGPIAIQLAHDHPERTDRVMLVCASIGHAATRLIRHFELAAMLPFLAGIGKYFHEPLHVAFRSFVRRPEISGLVRQSGFIGPETDVHAVVAYLQEIAACDARALLRVYEAVARERYDDLMKGITAPVFIVTGGKDRFATPRAADELAGRLPNASKKSYSAGSHFLPAEYPDDLDQDANDFFGAAGPEG